MEIATVITEGRNECVQLPEGLHVGSKEVFVKQVGRSIVLIPTDVSPWDVLTASLDEFTEDFMADRNQPGGQEREAAFE